MGWQHINGEFADAITNYDRQWFNPYLNYHRPCAFPTSKRDEKGKTRKVYTTYQTPYDALKGIPGAQKFLKVGQTFENLDTIAYEISDNEFAQRMREEERKLFETIRKRDQRPGSRRL